MNSLSRDIETKSLGLWNNRDLGNRTQVPLKCIRFIIIDSMHNFDERKQKITITLNLYLLFSADNVFLNFSSFSVFSGYMINKHSIRLISDVINSPLSNDFWSVSCKCGSI